MKISGPLQQKLEAAEKKKNIGQTSRGLDIWGGYDE